MEPEAALAAVSDDVDDGDGAPVDSIMEDNPEAAGA